MKLIVAISALAALVAAQDLNSLSDCGKTCVNNMVAKAAELGCQQGDTKCYCTNPNFGNGLRDCSLQACGPQVQAQVISFGQAYCASATGGSGASTTGGGSSSATASSSGASATASSASASASSAIASAKSSASNAVSSVSSSAVSAASSAASKASSSGSASSSSSAGFAMKTQAPLAAAGVLGLAALLV